MVYFSAKPKNKPHSLFLRERSKCVVNSYDSSYKYLTVINLRS
ncbi:MAG: hypothetical protein U5L45_10250 [Saprospiraceae bacterium]|nr:hypothetical protein [Saprospiraceae bacterium]